MLLHPDSIACQKEETGMGVKGDEEEKEKKIKVLS